VHKVDVSRPFLIFPLPGYGRSCSQLHLFIRGTVSGLYNILRLSFCQPDNYYNCVCSCIVIYNSAVWFTIQPCDIPFSRVFYSPYLLTTRCFM